MMSAFPAVDLRSTPFTAFAESLHHCSDIGGVQFTAMPSTIYPPAPNLHHTTYSSWDLNNQLASLPLPEVDLNNSSILDIMKQWLLESDSNTGTPNRHIPASVERNRSNELGFLPPSLGIDSGSSTNSSYSTPSNIQIESWTLPLTVRGKSEPAFHHASDINFTPSTSTFKITREIVLRSKNGDATRDIFYPQSKPVQIGNDQGVRETMTAGTTSYSLPPTEAFDPDLGADKIAKEQPEKRRGDEDLYTPTWVRGHGIHREGWCKMCNPGCWLNLKTSQYLYHVQNIHGIVQSTGRIASPPTRLRIYNDDVGTTEGHCGRCQQWIPICTARKRRSFSTWFEHARKCHHSQGQRTLKVRVSLQQPRAESSFPSSLRLPAAKKTIHKRTSSLQCLSFFKGDLESDFADDQDHSVKRVRYE